MKNTPHMTVYGHTSYGFESIGSITAGGTVERIRKAAQRVIARYNANASHGDSVCFESFTVEGNGKKVSV